MPPLNRKEGDILADVLRRFVEADAYPDRQRFRLDHESDRGVIDDLTRRGLLRDNGDFYALSLDGLLACKEDYANLLVEVCDALLPVLKGCFREDPKKLWSVKEVLSRSGAETLREIAGKLTVCAASARVPPAEVASGREIGKALSFLADRGIMASWQATLSGISAFHLAESVLDAEPIRESARPTEPPRRPDRETDRIERVEISGYRLFRDFRAEFGELTVVIGANGSGKSSLFDFFRFLGSAASSPLPAEIDPRSVGRLLFHSGGPERIQFSIEVDFGQATPLRYEAEIQGPKGTPRVNYERMSTTEPLQSNEKRPFVFLDFQGGTGVVRDQLQRAFVRPRWTLEPNELGLRRAVDPSLITLSRFQRFVTSWSFYSGFDMSTSGAIRRPVPTEPKPVLSQDGANLSALLFSLMAESRDAWREIETHVRSVVPGFLSLNVVPRGEPGSVIGEWIEEGAAGKPTRLTLADLSDGTLRFLCWAAICLSPTIPPLVCIDEPELGVHPRVLPILAGLFRVASQRSQIIIATHSPYFLSQFPLDKIAVMRKESGRAVFRRPANSKALKREIEELGAEALAQLHLSDELETRS